MPDYLFVTGNLAAYSLIHTLEKMEPDFEYEVAVLDISVAALMTTHWIASIGRAKLPVISGNAILTAVSSGTIDVPRPAIATCNACFPVICGLVERASSSSGTSPL